MMIRQQKDFWSGVMFFALGVMFIIWSREYQFGTAQRMGPGYFPTILGWLMAGVTAAVGYVAGRQHERRIRSAASAGGVGAQA